MAVKYNVYAGEASRYQQNDTHRVLFKDLAKELSKNNTFDIINAQSQKDDIRTWGWANTFGLMIATWVFMHGYQGYRQGDSLDWLVVGGLLVGMFLYSISLLFVIIFVKNKIDKKIVEVWLHENNETIKNFFLEFMDSINRKEQPRLAGCDSASLSGIYIIYDLERSQQKDDGFSVSGYYKVDNDTIKVTINLTFGEHYTRALVGSYNIEVE